MLYQIDQKNISFANNHKSSFIDRCQFLSSSLDRLVKNLGNDDFKYLSQKFDSNILGLVKQIGFYPYEYMSDIEKFKKQLPSKENFYSYEHVLNVWKKFKTKTVKNYQDLYLKCDVLLLADVFEKFRNKSLKNYGLCPSHYVSALGLSWDAILKMTKVELEFIPYPDIYLFFKKVWEFEFFIFLIGRVEPTINIQNLMTQNKNLNKYTQPLNDLYGSAMSKFQAD